MIPDDQRIEIQEKFQREIICDWSKRRVQEVQEIVYQVVNQNNQFASFIETQFIKTTPLSCLTESFTLEFLNYRCNSQEQKCSDWEYFRAKQPPTEFLQEEPIVEYYQGDVIGVIRIIYPEIITTLTVYRDFIDLGFIELETEINGEKFDLTDLKSQEIVMSLNAGIINNQKFMIDKNGFFKNLLNYYYPEEKQHTIPVNYHSASQISIEDEKTKISMNLLMEHPIGVSSQNNGQIEVMLKRFFEKESTVTKFRSFLGFYKNKDFLMRQEEITEILNSASLQFYAKTEKTQFSKEQTSSSLDLEPEIQIQFRLYQKDKILFHIINLSPTQSYQITLFDQPHNTTDNIFTKFIGNNIKCKNITETTLSGTQNISENNKKQLNWRNVNSAQQKQFLFAEKIFKNFDKVQQQQGVLILKPLDLRAFLFEFEE